MDEIGVILGAVSAGLSILMSILGWSVARNVRDLDARIERAEKATDTCKVACTTQIATVAADVTQLKLDHKDAAKSDDLHQLVQAVTRLEAQVASLSQQIAAMKPARKR